MSASTIKRPDSPSDTQHKWIKLHEPQGFEKSDADAPKLSSADFGITEAFIIENELTVFVSYPGQRPPDFHVYVDTSRQAVHPPIIKLHIVRSDTDDLRKISTIQPLRVDVSDGRFSSPCVIQLHCGEKHLKTVER